MLKAHCHKAVGPVAGGNDLICGLQISGKGFFHQHIAILLQRPDRQGFVAFDPHRQAHKIELHTKVEKFIGAFDNLRAVRLQFFDAVSPFFRKKFGSGDQIHPACFRQTAEVIHIHGTEAADSGDCHFDAHKKILYMESSQFRSAESCAVRAASVTLKVNAVSDARLSL